MQVLQDLPVLDKLGQDMQEKKRTAVRAASCSTPRSLPLSSSPAAHACTEAMTALPGKHGRSCAEVRPRHS
jgi:hypothetical protein